MPSQRKSLYASSIQHVLVLAEEDEEERAAHEAELRAQAQALASAAASSSTTLSHSKSPTERVEEERKLFPWRVKDRMKTAHIVLMVCLNIGVDPPESNKPDPCARLECWIHPTLEVPTSLKSIVQALKDQYMRWQAKSRFRIVADPTAKDLKAACISMRKGAKQDRVLFHYNGHGVPDPTPQGELWVFNHSYTQYIPLPLEDIHELLGSPCIWVLDCNSAGRILHNYKHLLDRIDRRYRGQRRTGHEQAEVPNHRKTVIMAACKDGEKLPTSAHLPADLFTCCLTTPIKTFLHWFVQQTLVMGITDDMVDRVPGCLNDRDTPLGELNWIFVAVTDAIAWNVLDREKFLRLYRQDVLLASLLRNFLLAERIMRSYDCHPVSHPTLPETHNHSLWKSFDVAVEKLFSQLPTLIAEEEAKAAKLAEMEALAMAQNISANGVPPDSSYLPTAGESHMKSPGGRGSAPSSSSRRSLHAFENVSSSELIDPKQKAHEGCYDPSTFFEEQMKAFDVWLDMGPDQRGPPEQLPIMLQVLLSGELRKTALPLLSRYLQTGPVAVDLFLSVGIFPYIMRLLEGESQSQRQELVFVWSKILALDSSCCDDLVEKDGEKYFVGFLTVDRTSGIQPKPVYLAVAMFVLSVVAKRFPERCGVLGITEACLDYMSHSSRVVRRWACLCIMMVLRHAPAPMQSLALANSVLLDNARQCATMDECSDVRASAACLLSALMGEVLSQQSPQNNNESGEPSHGSRSEYQPSGPRSDINSLLGSGKIVRSSGEGGANRVRTAAEIVMENDMHTPSVEAEFLDAPVSSYSPDERNALLYVGTLIAQIGRRDSSTLVRREVSIAIARAVRLQRDRFVRAAYITDVIGIDESKAVPETDIYRCEAVYRKLWMTLSEIAFDPHPVVAALARRSYDLISEVLLDRAGPLRGSARSSSSDDIPPTDHVFSPPVSSNSNFITSGSTPPRESADFEVSNQAGNRGGKIPPLATGSGGRFIPRSMNRQSLRRPNQTRPVDARIPTSSIHVRSTSGSFDLNTSLRLPLLSSMPRVNSASLLLPMSKSSSNRAGLSAAASSQDLTATRLRSVVAEAEERPRSLPRMAVAQGVTMLLKTMSEKLNHSGLEAASAALPRSFGSNSSCGGKEDGNEPVTNPKSPTRAPKRNLSYQVLNAATGLSPNGEIPIAASSRPTYFASARKDDSDESLTRVFKIPEGYDRLYLSQHGDAALSLYEWSSANVARVEFDAFDESHDDSVSQKESVPRYAALWDKFLKSSGKIPSDALRAFALLGERQNGMGVGSCGRDDGDSNGFVFLEVSSHMMGAGGGAITSMAFLPRDVGMGEDQLIATGDSSGAVGVYDVRSGKRHAVIDIPYPPGIPEVGVSAVLCLNRPSPATIGTDFSFGNSRSALILAGAYDGRVGIFKSDLHSPKYRIMSTFQSSGQSYWSKVGSVREPLQKPPQHDVMNGTYHSSDSTASFESYEATFAETVKDSGNGLVLAFDSNSSYLAAGGCDAEIVRIWDLAQEYCIWEGVGVEKETWPTAVTMWGRLNPKVFVTGSSNGMINVIDMREQAPKLMNFGRTTEPIISLGTCPPVGGCSAEVVVSADIGGEIAFWDPRWTRNSLPPLALNGNAGVSHIKAHRSNLTSMTVHPAGSLIASGSTARCVKIFGPNRRMLMMMSVHNSQEAGHDLTCEDDRIPPVTSLSFQPESNLLAIGSLDSSVLVYGRPDMFPGVHAPEDQITEAERSALYEYGR